MKMTLTFETEEEVFEESWDFENEKAELLGFVISEIEEDDYYILIAVDGNCYVSKSAADIVWFLESYLKRIDELINIGGKSPEFDSLEMDIMIRCSNALEEAFGVAESITEMKFYEPIEDNEEDFIFPHDLDKIKP